MRRNARALVFLILASPLLLLQVSCTDANLQTVAKDMLIVSTAVGTLQTDVIAANQSKLLDDATTTKILQVCLKINASGKQVDAVLRSISQLDPASRSSLVALLTPISQALDPTQLVFITGIKDPATQQKIEGAFALMRSTISAVQLILAGGA